VRHERAERRAPIVERIGARAVRVRVRVRDANERTAHARNFKLSRCVRDRSSQRARRRRRRGVTTRSVRQPPTATPSTLDECRFASCEEWDFSVNVRVASAWSSRPENVDAAAWFCERASIATIWLNRLEKSTV